LPKLGKINAVFLGLNPRRSAFFYIKDLTYQQNNVRVSLLKCTYTEGGDMTKNESMVLMLVTIMVIGVLVLAIRLFVLEAMFTSFYGGW
jgi:hypothetical protein